ncbi:FAD/NAD(P)-binding protein [Streptomyces sp. NBC_00335]|uniref:FAD/NAD(P)-binding protein n=1 Tax=unclassified Streptomyces TaxID=2593676 RepID=UPI00224E625A|nr:MULTISPECIES: FAD/NAD(P)-binding protein [unclassified Streptomyces]MCX5404863.1 FAD/NAD(P)-binding protein [Streptomyces sp. NBC_00086]
MLTVSLVGAGPRGFAVLERLCANERKSPSHRAVTVHVVEPHAPGPGRVWRTEQPRQLLMNTVASQVTVYTDHSVLMDGPVEEGPSLYEWAAALARDAEEPAVRDRLPAEALAEARRLGPDDYPTRAFYGAYLEDAFRAVTEAAPGHVTIVEHRTRAVALTDEAGHGGPQTLELADGTRLTGLDAVVLSLGHVPARPTRGESALARAAAAHGLTYIGPSNPADVDFSVVAPGETVFVRGLGLNCFDVLALLTEGRGGTFAREGGALRYLPSGREPNIVAGSRRGVPYHARGENQKGPYERHEPRLLTPRAIDRLHRRAQDGERLHFLTDLWPLIAKEVEGVYYGALLAARGRERQRASFVEHYLAAPDPASEGRLLDSAGIAPHDRWDWERLARPYRDHVLRGRADHRAWLLAHLAEDVRQARAGNVHGPLKSALDVLRDLRNEIRLAVDHGKLEGASYRDDLQSWYTPLNAFLSIGPPASRIEELIALIEAGVVEVLGPGVRLHAPAADDREAVFTVTSDVVPGAPVAATALVEARLPEPDLPRTAEPLLRDLLESGQAARHRIEGACGIAYETKGLAVTERPYRLVDAGGRAHPRRFAYGVPTEAVHWVTAAGSRPGVNSMTLGDADAIACAVLALPVAPRTAGPPGRYRHSPTDHIEVNA